MRRWMIELRDQMGLDMHAMAKRCGCSVTLLEYLEEGDSKTLPTLARQIGIAYGMTLIQANELAKPLQPRYVMLGGKGGGGYEWHPPKAETVPLITFVPEKEKERRDSKEISREAARLVQATGKSARQLSVDAGRTGSYVGNILMAIGRGRVLSPGTRKTLMEILG